MFEHGLFCDARNDTAMVPATAIKPAKHRCAATLTNTNTRIQQPLKKTKSWMPTVDTTRAIDASRLCADAPLTVGCEKFGASAEYLDGTLLVLEQMDKTSGERQA
ncbi:MAG: hypothetical protein IH899_07495 [Planctomycetes bacterium]|nr:hypothetical protein [Planctomycetota bacterium]